MDFEDARQIDAGEVLFQRYAEVNALRPAVVQVEQQPEVARRADAVKTFADADRRAATLIAAGARAKPGSDAWLDAQVSLGALDTERANIISVQTELEETAIARATEGQPPYPALERAQAETKAALDAIDATLAKRKAALPL